MAEKLPEKRPETGWGEKLQPYFDSTKVRIDNRAKNGRSTRTFISEGLWQAIVDSLRAGDYVFIEFGHNDESVEKTDRYTPPTDFRANLSRMVNDVRAKKGNPVLLTPVYRRKFDDAGKLVDTHGEYPGYMRAVAAEQHVPLIEMHSASGALLARFGPDSSRTLFLQLKPGENPNYPTGIEDNTHYNPRGAALAAELAVKGMREVGLPLAKLLR